MRRLSEITYSCNAVSRNSFGSELGVRFLLQLRVHVATASVFKDVTCCGKFTHDLCRNDSSHRELGLHSNAYCIVFKGLVKSLKSEYLL